MLGATDLTSLQWSETRIYTADQTDRWYLHLLGLIAQPFLKKFPDTPFWFTRYECSNAFDPPPSGFEIPANCLFPLTDGPANQRGSRSLRFRFVGSSEKEGFFTTQEQVVPNLLAHTPIAPFRPIPGFGGPEFCADQSPTFAAERANIDAHLLCWGARLALHAIVQRHGELHFETNNADQLRRTSFRKPLHLLVNAFGGPDGSDLRVYLGNPASSPADLARLVGYLAGC